MASVWFWWNHLAALLPWITTVEATSSSNSSWTYRSAGRWEVPRALEAIGEIGEQRILTGWVLPRNLTWNLKMMVSKRNHLFQGLLFRFHVKFQGCIFQGHSFLVIVLGGISFFHHGNFQNRVKPAKGGKNSNTAHPHRDPWGMIQFD